MNYEKFKITAEEKTALSSLGSDLPHAFIIEGGDPASLKRTANFLAAKIICKSDDAPCGVCRHCFKILNEDHPDVYLSARGKKSKTVVSIDQIRDITHRAYTKPNEADTNVFIFERADEWLRDIQQNSLLKLVEEPPNAVIIFLCKSAMSMLQTIRSRCALIQIKSTEVFDEKSLEAARRIVRGILSSREYELLTAAAAIEDKKSNKAQILAATNAIITEALFLALGRKAATDPELSEELRLRFSQKTITQLRDATEALITNIKQNANSALLSTFLCAEYRRISWQR